uniref:Tectonic family member 2 n=1 Tax=Sander lucioperca TaxID=283035 RepID=A0A8C9X129_SANLU
MANLDNLLFSQLSISRQLTCVLLFISLAHTQNIVVFQPSRLTATGPAVTALLLGNTSDISLNLRTVSPSNTTGSVGSPSCEADVTQWVLTREQVGKTAVRVQLSLNKSLRLCGRNEADTNCCPKPLCVLETLQVTACVGSKPQASLLIQAKIHALLVPANAGSDNKTVIPNQVYQPLGSCPCDLTYRACDVRCCCDKDCSIEDLKLFVSHCFPGPFGGQVSPAPDYQCSVQSFENSPDWFQFLCVNSPPENNPYLGLFYQGNTITSKPGPSFQRPVLSAPVPGSAYIQGSPIFLMNDQYFTVPQKVLGRCVNSAPVAFLRNFKVNCVTLLRSCPTGSPLQTLPTNLRTKVKNGQGGDVTVDVIDEVAIDTRHHVVDYWLTVCSIIVSYVYFNQNKLSKRQHQFLIWLTVSDGLCSTAETKPVLFGENSTSGCLLPVSQHNLTQCSLLRSVTQHEFMCDLFVTHNSSTTMEDTISSCHRVPSHQHIHVWSLITGMVEGIPQRDIQALQVRCVSGVYSLFQINFTEYDCNRNDVCWPELAFPITKYYTGEPYSQSLAKGLILVFFFITASILGTPWRQIRQAWN